MSSAVLAKGTQLQVEDSPGAGTYTTIAEVRSIQGPDNEAAEVDVTNMDSGAYLEFIGGLIDPGSLQFPLNWFYHAKHSQLLTDQQAGTTRSYRLRFPQFSPVQRRTFNGFVKSVGFNADPKDTLQANVVIRITGAITDSTE